MMLAGAPAVVPLTSVATLPALGEDVAGTREEARAFMGRVRAEVRERHDRGAGGLALVATYTEAIDRLVVYLFTSASAHFLGRYPRINQRCTLIGQGGYGRGELNPSSDIDLLFLYPWKVNPYVETVAEVILYALWDAGLAVGHALRNMRECANLAARDLKAKTAILDARYLCGDEALYAEFEERMQEEVWSRQPTQFFKEKLAESQQRHQRAGDSVYLLQPQLKEGQGGLRDLHTALWMAKVKFKVRSFRELVTLGVFGERPVATLEAALDFLWRVRDALHLATGTHQDQLTFEFQERLAPTLGFPAGREGVEAFMRTYYGHATTVNLFSDMVIGRCVQVPEPYRGWQPNVRPIRDGMRIQGRMLVVTGPEVFAHDPAAVVQVFAEAQRHGATLAPATLDLLRDALPVLAAGREGRAVAAAFLAVLRARGHVYETLFEMHKLGVLKALIPEFAHLDCLIAHDPFHIYTVDHHSLMGVRELERLRAGEFSREVPYLTQVMREVAQPELLFLGMMFHDVGKGHGHDHSGRGARMMRAIGERLGLNVDERAACEFLVQHHLLMSHLSQRRDVHDDQLVIDFCRTVGTVENLQRLYLLTYADMRAVGPGVWNNWRDTLLGELYVRGREFFEKGVFAPEDRAARAARIRTRVLSSVPEEQRAEMARCLATLPESYFLSTPEDAIAAHADLRRRFEADEAAGARPALATLLVHTPERGSSELTVCTRDRPGLFAILSGGLAAHSCNILAARIATSTDGVALDAFRVSHQDAEATDDQGRWERVEQTLRAALAGEIDMEELVRRAQRPSLLTRRRRRVATTVEIDNRVSDRYTVLDVYTGDRVGLLFTITNCLYHLWLQIHLAKITTMVDQVLDVFYVTDHEGRKIEDRARLDDIRRALTTALEPQVPPEAVRAAGA